MEVGSPLRPGIKTETGPDATNWKTGHAWPRTAAPEEVVLDQRQELLQVGVDVVSTDKCKGLFHHCNRTHCDESTASGHKTLEARPRGHDLLLGLPRAGLRGLLFLRGRPVAPARAASRAPAARAPACRLRLLELGGAAGDKSPEELTADPIFTGSPKSRSRRRATSRRWACRRTTSGLVISYGGGGSRSTRPGRRRAAPVQTAFSVTYTIVYDPDVRRSPWTRSPRPSRRPRDRRGPSWRRSTRRWPKSAGAG